VWCYLQSSIAHRFHTGPASKYLAFGGSYCYNPRLASGHRFHGKRARRVWTKRVKYDVRKDFASTRPRVEGRFAKKEEEDLLKLIGALDGAISPRTM
jgi:hypothetical protein